MPLHCFRNIRKHCSPVWASLLVLLGMHQHETTKCWLVKPSRIIHGTIPVPVFNHNREENVVSLLPGLAATESGAMPSEILLYFSWHFAGTLAVFPSLIARWCLQENERLQKEVDELNSTVFSKSFKAPSAWAEREVKYKMEKKAWDEQVWPCLPSSPAKETCIRHQCMSTVH